MWLPSLDDVCQVSSTTTQFLPRSGERGYDIGMLRVLPRSGERGYGTVVLRGLPRSGERSYGTAVLRGLPRSGERGYGDLMLSSQVRRLLGGVFAGVTRGGFTVAGSWSRTCPGPSGVPYQTSRPR